MARRFFSLLALILVQSLLSTTTAQDIRIDATTTEEAAAVTGQETDVPVFYDTDDEHAIGGLETAEVSNKPCRLGITRKNLDTGETRSFTYGQQQINLECNVDMLWELLPSRKSAGFFYTNRRFVRAVAACVNDNNGRIKGLRVTAATVSLGGEVSPIQATDEFERPNCRGNWQDPSVCPADMVASGLIAYMTEPNGLVGIRLKCSRVMGGYDDTHVAEEPGYTPPPGSTFSCDDLAQLSWAGQVAFSQMYSNSCADDIEDAWDNAAIGGGRFDMSGLYTMKVFDPQAASTVLAQTRVEIEQTGRQILFNVDRGLNAWDLAEVYVMRGLQEQSRVLDVIGEDGDRINAEFRTRIKGTLRLDNRGETPAYPIELIRMGK